ncbi:MAG: hypothetical protein ACOCRK_03755 [bacterium]
MESIEIMDIYDIFIEAIERRKDRLINYISQDYSRIVECAARVGYTSILEHILKKTDINPNRKSGYILKLAISHDRYEIVKMIIEDPRMDLSNPNDTWFYKIKGMSNSRELFGLMLETQKVRLETSDIVFLLEYIIYEKDDEILMKLIKRPDFNIQEYSFMLVGYSIDEEKSCVLEYIVDYLSNEEANTFMKKKFIYKNSQVVESILSKYKIKLAGNKYLFSWAVSNNKLSIVKKILQDPDMNCYTHSKKLVKTAMLSGYHEMTKILFDAGVNRRIEKEDFKKIRTAHPKILKMYLKHSKTLPTDLSLKYYFKMNLLGVLVNKVKNYSIDIRLIKYSIKYNCFEKFRQLVPTFYEKYENYILRKSIYYENKSIVHTYKDSNRVIECMIKLDKFKLLIEYLKVNSIKKISTDNITNALEKSPEIGCILIKLPEYKMNDVLFSYIVKFGHLEALKTIAKYKPEYIPGKRMLISLIEYSYNNKSLIKLILEYYSWVIKDTRIYYYN